LRTPESIPEEIRKNINFYNGDRLGRIYRIAPNHPLRRGDLKPNLGALDSDGLVKQLANPNGWNRVTAQRLLLERQDRAVIPYLKAMAANGPSPEARVHALWLLQAFTALNADDVGRALKDADSGIRENALRLSESFSNGSKVLQDAVLAATGDPDPRVQFQASLTLGELKDNRAFAALLDLAHGHSSDPWFRLAILSSVADSASPFFHAALAKGESWTDPQLLMELSALIGARQDGNEIGRWFRAAPKLTHPEKALEGLTRGLKLSTARNLKALGAEHALTQLLASGSEPVQRAAWEASRYFELTTLLQRAGKDAVSSDLPTPKRVLAIRALRGGHYESVAPVLQRVIETHPAPEVETAAIDSLAAFDEPAAGKAILDRWRSYSPTGRKHAIDAMLAQKNRIPLLLKAIEDERVERAAVDAGARSHLYDVPDAAIAQKARALLESTNSDRVRVVAAYHDVLSMKGDAARGKKAFDETCGRCHMPRRQGGARVGPDLSGINNKTKEELLTSILNPSYAIEPRFVNYVVMTHDGRMYDGVIANETPGAITLRGGSEDGDETVLRKNIAEMRASTVSLMPEDLEKGLSKQDLADVIAYLRGGL
jgi:putative heme-binding domain-containing protein